MLIVSNGAFKSGSTWLYRIARLLVRPRRIPKEFRDPNLVHESVAREHFERFLASAPVDRVDYVSANHVRDPGAREILLSHENVRVLNITRDLRDVLVSAYFHDRREGRIEGTIDEYWRDLGRKRIERNIAHHRLWNTGHAQVFVTSYEALHASFEFQVRALAAFLGIEAFDLEAIRAETNFDRLRSRAKSKTDDPFHRKGIVGDWQNHLTPEIVDELWQLAGAVGGSRVEPGPSPEAEATRSPSARRKKDSRRRRTRSRRRYDAVVIHQMGKVGSRSLYEAVDELGQWPCFHTHLLNPSDRALADVAHIPKGRTGLPRHLANARTLRAEYLDRDRPVAIVTAIRDPIGRNVSAFFQRLNEFLGEGDVDASDARSLYDLFKAEFPHRRPQTWLEEELNEPFGVDVLKHPFPERGWIALDADPHRLLVLRTSMPDEEKGATLARFLDVDRVKVARVHETRDTRDAAVYERFKRLVGKDVGYIDEMLSMPMAEHFFAERERAQIREGWLNLGET